tara:strand:+ start:282 stop:983 length:702 start_codon:yes stop_codon:yes gene_type:complete
MNKIDRFFYINKKLDEIKNPIIVELGVAETAQSTKNFLNYVNEKGGKLYSIDIQDFSKIVNSGDFKSINSKNWNFLQCNDLNIEKIFYNFPVIKNGIDVLYVDSLHDPTHVEKTLIKWFKYINQFGYIFFDDTESRLYKEQKALLISIGNDGIDDVIKKFYYRNSNLIKYTKYFIDTGLSEFYKICDKNIAPDFSKKLWDYNSFFGKIYLLLLKLNYFLKKKDKIEKINNHKN